MHMSAGRLGVIRRACRSLPFRLRFTGYCADSYHAALLAAADNAAAAFAGAQ
jgi:hypothetical protein